MSELKFQFHITQEKAIKSVKSTEDNQVLEHIKLSFSNRQVHPHLLANNCQNFPQIINYYFEYYFIATTTNKFLQRKMVSLFFSYAFHLWCKINAEYCRWAVTNTTVDMFTV